MGEDLREQARTVLDGNWIGSSTIPSRGLYPHQWSWDAAFIAIGRSWAEQRRAQEELETLPAAQWANGMVPHIVFNPAVPTEDYFPGPDFWQSERCPNAPHKLRTSGITQPPLHARAALEIYQHASDRDEALAFLGRVYSKLAAQHAYLARWRDVGGHGLAAIVHPWESGLDNSPLWDSELDSLVIPPGALPRYQRADLRHANAADRPTDAAYDRYVYLAITYRDADYDDATLLDRSPFLVESVLFNAIYLWSVRALAEIAALLGTDPGPHREQAARLHDAILARFWDPSCGHIFGYDVRNGCPVPKDSIASMTPLLDPDLPGEVAAAIVADLSSPHFTAPAAERHHLFPSYDLEAPDFDRRRYWRGPVWINTDWLVWRGLRQHGAAALAKQVEHDIVALVERSGFREYFDPFGGEGYGGMDFSWTAALLLDVLASRERPA
ncbi:MAG TPA: hypothetical protein VF995_06655 [Actinomycetota bacterium]